MIYTKELYECQERLITSLEEKIKINEEYITHLERLVTELQSQKQREQKYRNMKGKY